MSAAKPSGRPVGAARDGRRVPPRLRSIELPTYQVVKGDMAITLPLLSCLKTSQPVKA